MGLFVKRIIPYCSLALLFLPLFLSAQKVISLRVDGTINPVTASYIQDGIGKAKSENASCVLIHLNTPGGLLKSTRVIVTEILDSSVPVIVYVSPAGSHAGSAGVFITMAAHIAAMAPGTNIGAAHPVLMQSAMDSTMNQKATNDAAAFIRTIAEKRNRNLEWAEDAVRNSVSITETEAIKNRVVDIIAVDDKDLLEQIDGKTININGRQLTLATRNAPVEKHEMRFIDRLLDLLSDPNIAYILLLLGIYGIMFELYNPGAILPGVVGVISLILAFYSMHTLPVNYAGLALIIFAVVLFILEIKIVSHGLLAAGGVVSLLLGSLMLIRSGSSLEFLRISRGLIIGATAVTAAFFLFIVGAGLRVQKRKIETGSEAMVGVTGEVIETLDPEGMIMVQGEIWKAVSLSGEIKKGGRVRIKEIKGLTLYVEPITNI